VESWLLGILGVVFLGVLFDLIYPNGKTNLFCKSIFGIIAVVVMISPIFKFDVDKLINTSYGSQVLIDNVNFAKVKAYELELTQKLKNKNIDGVFVELYCNFDNNNFEIENIYIDTTDLVLTDNLTNINKYEVIINEVVEMVNINRERIIVYG